MSPSLRFLAVALVGWAGVRAATLGVVPGAELFRVDRSEAKTVPPIVATDFPPIEPMAPAPQLVAAPLPYSAGFPASAVQVQPVAVPVYYPASRSAYPEPPAESAALPTPRPQFYGPIPALEQWPLSRIAAT